MKYNSNPRLNRRSLARLDQRKRLRSRSSQLEATISKRSSFDDLKTTRSNLVIKKVTILRRGDSLDLKIKSSDSSLMKEGDGGFVVTGMERLGLDLEIVPKQIRIINFKILVTGTCDVYARLAFAVSPVSSSLLLPSFSRNKQVFIDDSATRDLR